MNLVLSGRNLSKHYGNKEILKDLSFDIHRGESVALIGANGAGKSTLIKTLLGLVFPESGQFIWFNNKPQQIPFEKIGYVPEVAAFWPELNALEYLQLFIKQMAPKETRPNERIEDVLKAVGLFTRAAQPMGSFSKGMIQRASLARSLVHDPEVFILDEPMSGLDPRAQEKLRQIILHLMSRGKTIIICSHSLDDVHKLSQRTLVLERGVLADQGPSPQVLLRLRDRYQKEEPWDEDPLGDISHV